jgi:hypothetical protein
MAGSDWSRTLVLVALSVQWLASGCGAVSAIEDGGSADAPTPTLTIVGPARSEVPRYNPPELVDVEARFPWNGYRTGGAVVPLDAPVRDHPLRPRFVWGRVHAATYYELEVDDSCDPHDYAGCELPSPEAVVVTTETDVNLEEPLPISMVAPVGRRYFWRVRACDEVECTAWSRVRYVHVGRASSDYDGDGYPDLAIARHTRASGQARGDIRVWRGGPAGLDAERTIPLLDDGRELRGEYVGSIGDLNGDGYDELFTLAGQVTGEAEWPSEYRAAVWWGSDAGPRDPATVPLYAGYPRANVWVEAIGDVDADGFDDAYRHPGHCVIYGESDGLSVDERPLIEPWPVPHPGVLDVNGDGYLDLVWARVPRVDIEGAASTLTLRFGGAGIRGPQAYTVSFSSLPYYSAYAPFFRVDDGDRDGFAELAIHSGVDLYVWEAGGALSAILEPDLWLPGMRDSAIWRPGSSGDVNGDGFADMAVRRGYGEVDLDVEVVSLLGNAEGEARIDSVARVHDPAGAISGDVSALLDYDGDGYDDQIWVVNVATIEGGTDWRVLVSPGGPAGLPWQPTREVHRFEDETMLGVVLRIGQYGWD